MRIQKHKLRTGMPELPATDGCSLHRSRCWRRTLQRHCSRAAWRWSEWRSMTRPSPSAFDSSIKPLTSIPNVPVYPSEHAVVAGAVSVVMAYLFPAMGETYFDLAEEAARSRVFAGAAFPSDVNAGLQLGRQVGKMVIAYAMADGSNTPFTGSFPSPPGVWGSATPVTPLAGSWKPWTLTSLSQFRLPAPPAASSPDFQAQVAT